MIGDGLTHYFHDIKVKYSCGTLTVLGQFSDICKPYGGGSEISEKWPMAIRVTVPQLSKVKGMSVC